MRVTLRSQSRCLGWAIVGYLAISNLCQAQVAPAVLPHDPSPPQGEFVNRVYKDEAGDHKYVVFVPAGYSAKKKWPTILFLHGACNRGTDGRSQLVSGMAPSIRLRMADYPFLVVFPQCENTQSRVLGGWTDQPDDAERALKILDAVEQDYSVDKKRECLVGLSMGGTGAWDIATRTASRWAALVPVSAMAKTADAPKVASIPTWVFHATSDPLVTTNVATDMVAAVNAAGGRAYFSEVSKRAHDLSNVVFTQAALTDWLLDPSQAPKLENLSWKEPTGYNNGHELEVPFVAGAEIARAVRFRLCKDVLDALCFAAPLKMAAKPITGQVGGIHQTTKIGGMLPIDVALSGLYYRGHVERVQITPMANNRLIIQAGLRNMTMTVSNAQMNGKLLLQASAGSMNVVIGHRAPVWLTAELRPFVEDRKLRLNLVAVDFKIPNDNWYVTEPNGVQVRGLPFLKDKVSEGLVDGIYGRKNEIEQQVLNAIPRAVLAFETKLNDALKSKTISVGQIAMPIWQPRMRTFPEEIKIDEHGITLVSGVVLATLGQIPKDFKMRKYPALDDAPPAIETGMEIDIAESVVPAWSDLIMTGRVNRFNVFDFIPKEYHALADRQFLQEIIPDLRKFGEDMEANVDFKLRDPIHLLDPDEKIDVKQASDSANNAMTLSLTSVPLSVSVRRKGETKWTPVGELDFGIEKNYAPYVRKNGFVRRGPKFADIGEFRINSKWTFASEYQPEIQEVDEKRLVACVLKAREAAALLEGVSPDAVHDVDLAGVPLRMDAMDWVKKHLVVQYQLPGVLLTNTSTEPLTYEIKGANTKWSAPRTLDPGDFDIYRRVPYALTWRSRQSGQLLTYTLPMGKEVTYRSFPKPGMVLVNHDEELMEERVFPQQQATTEGPVRQ